MQSAGTYQTTPPSLTNGQVAALQVDAAGNLKVTSAASAPVIASGIGYTSQVSVTRPADTTAYAAGDVVGAAAAAITFPNIGAAAGTIILTSADLRIDVSSIPAGMTSFRLHLYNITPPSALADNAPWDLPSGDRASYLGYIDLGSPVDLGSTLFVQTPTDFRKEILMGASTSLFGYLVTAAGYTPTSAAVKSIRLNAVGS